MSTLEEVQSRRSGHFTPVLIVDGVFRDYNKVLKNVPSAPAVRPTMVVPSGPTQVCPAQSGSGTASGSVV